MKTVIIIKLFIVMCCQTVDNGHYRYEVKSVENNEITGVVYSSAQYTEGDTIKIPTYKN